jgi:hypothetical protein
VDTDASEEHAVSIFRVEADLGRKLTALKVKTGGNIQIIVSARAT